MLPEIFSVDSRLPEVEGYGASLDVSASRLESYRRLLTDGERAKAERFATPRLRDRAVASRGFLKRVLGDRLGADPLTLQLSLTPNGKPYLPGSSLRFNLSHSGNIAVIALSEKSEVGIDVEEMGRTVDYQEIVREFFSVAEGEFLRGLTSDERPAAFFRMWTGKEAVAKCFGEGLSFALKQVEMVSPLPSSSWTVEYQRLFNDYALSIAVPR